MPYATESGGTSERVGALGYGGLHNPAGTFGAIGEANLLATRTVQRALMGDTAAQEAIGDLINAHPESVAAIKRVNLNALRRAPGQVSGSDPTSEV